MTGDKLFWHYFLQATEAILAREYVSIVNAGFR